MKVTRMSIAIVLCNASISCVSIINQDVDPYVFRLAALLNIKVSELPMVIYNNPSCTYASRVLSELMCKN